MSWQEEYNKRYEAKLADNWTVDGRTKDIKAYERTSRIRVECLPLDYEAMSNKDATCSTIYHLNGTSHYCSSPSEHEGQCTFPTLWNNFMNTREICGND